jgi:hypothetical protein
MLLLVALCEERAVRASSYVCTRSSVTMFLSIFVRACSYIYVSSSMLALPGENVALTAAARQVLATCHDTFRHNVDTTATGLFSAGRHDLVRGKISRHLHHKPGHSQERLDGARSCSAHWTRLGPHALRRRSGCARQRTVKIKPVDSFLDAVLGRVMPEIVRVALVAGYFRTLTALPQTAMRDLPKQDAPVTIIM